MLNSPWSSSGTSSLPTYGYSTAADATTTPAIASITARWCSDQTSIRPYTASIFA